MFGSWPSFRRPTCCERSSSAQSQGDDDVVGLFTAPLRDLVGVLQARITSSRSRARALRLRKRLRPKRPSLRQSRRSRQRQSPKHRQSRKPMQSRKNSRRATQEEQPAEESQEGEEQ